MIKYLYNTIGKETFEYFKNETEKYLYFKFNDNKLYNNLINAKILCKRLLAFFEIDRILMVYEPECIIEIYIIVPETNITYDTYKKIANNLGVNCVSKQEKILAIGSQIGTTYKVPVNINTNIEKIKQLSTSQKYLNFSNIKHNENIPKIINLLTNIDTGLIKNISDVFVKNSYIIKNNNNINVDKSLLLTIDDIYNKYNNISNLSDFTLGDRYKELNNVLKDTLLGDLIGIVAASGVGKTTLAMDFCNEYCKATNSLGIFFSLEMSAPSCFLRCSTITANPIENKIYTSAIKQKIKQDYSFVENVKKDWNNMFFVDNGSISLEMIEKIIEIAQEETNNKVKIIAIDYAQYIEEASNISKARDIARETKNVIKRKNIYGILTIQTGKRCPDIFTEVFDEHIEGVAAIKQATDYLLALWKNKDDKTMLYGKFLKSRWSSGDESFILKRNGLKYYSMSNDQINI